MENLYCQGKGMLKVRDTDTYPMRAINMCVRLRMIYLVRF